MNPARLEHNTAQRQEHHDSEDSYQTYNVELEIELKRIYKVRAKNEDDACLQAQLLVYREFPEVEFMTFDVEVAG